MQIGTLRGLAVILVLCLNGNILHGYSVLTHEQVIDLAWEERIQPMLLKRFPQASPQDLKRAHAFAYGGSLV